MSSANENEIDLAEQQNENWKTAYESWLATDEVKVVARQQRKTKTKADVCSWCIVCGRAGHNFMDRCPRAQLESKRNLESNRRAALARSRRNSDHPIELLGTDNKVYRIFTSVREVAKELGVIGDNANLLVFAAADWKGRDPLKSLAYERLWLAMRASSLESAKKLCPRLRFRYREGGRFDKEAEAGSCFGGWQTTSIFGGTRAIHCSAIGAATADILCVGIPRAGGSEEGLEHDIPTHVASVGRNRIELLAGDWNHRSLIADLEIYEAGVDICTGSSLFVIKPHEVARLGSPSSQKLITKTVLHKWRPDPKGLSGEKPYSLY